MCAKGVLPPFGIILHHLDQYSGQERDFCWSSCHLVTSRTQTLLQRESFLVLATANRVSTTQFHLQRRELVSKETVVLRRWGSETQNFGLIR